MRILLIDPPYQRLIGYYRFYFPLGLAYIAAVLRNQGHDVLIYDAEHDMSCFSPSMKDAAEMHRGYLRVLGDDNHQIWNELRSQLCDFRPDVVGITVLTAKVESAIKVARLVKQHNPGIVVITGGEHVTARPEDMPTAFVDHVVIGEGERGISELISRLGVSGIPRVIRTDLIEDLDSIPRPALDALHCESSYRAVDMGLMVTARGCPFSCRFCALSLTWGHRVRFHSVDRVMVEMRTRSERYGTHYFSFRNGTFSVNRKRVLEFCGRLQAESLRVNWECLTRVDVIDAELIATMQAAGCSMIRIGIESGSTQMLKYMNKQITIKQIKEAARVLGESGIFWSSYFMLGVPEETEESIQATMELIDCIDPPFVTLARFSPLPGTPMFEEIVQFGGLNPDSGSWDWAANQSMGRAFVHAMEEGRFLELMSQAATYVQKRNEQWAQRGVYDPRLKL